MPKIAFLFPGQGSQEVGMGRAIHDSSAAARRVFDLGDKVTGSALTDLCFNGPLEDLTRTANLQPCLTMVSLALLAALTEEAGIIPEASAGHSVGEYPALACAGVLPPERAIALTAMRGDYMDRDAGLNPGSMAAVIGLPMDQVRAGVADISGVQVANHNAETQIVITGETEAVAQASARFKEKKAKVIPLKVSGAWHSRLMSQAANDFAIRLAQTEWLAARIPIYLNVTAKPETDARRIGEIMSGQLVSPVRWYDIMKAMRADGFDTFVEVGPKNVLAGLAKKAFAGDDGVNVVNVDGPEGVEALRAILS